MSRTLKIGDRVKFVKHLGDTLSVTSKLELNKNYTILQIGGPVGGYDYLLDNGSPGGWWVKNDCIKPLKGESYMDSIKDYLKEHKSILMTIGLVLVVDHLVFDGAFREKVKEIINKMLGKVEKQLDSNKGE